MRKIDLLRGHPGTGALACCFYYKDFGAPVSIWESWGYRTVGTLLRVTFFVTDFLFWAAKTVIVRPARPPEYAEKDADSCLQPHVSGIVGLLLQKCRKK